MEKVVIIHNGYYLRQEDAEPVNKLLQKGWTVKSVTTQDEGESITAIFVLKKDEE